MSDDSIKCAATTPSGDLLRDLMDPNVPKSEREWFASNIIAALKAEVERLRTEKKDFISAQGVDYSAVWDEYQKRRERVEELERELAEETRKEKAALHFARNFERERDEERGKVGKWKKRVYEVLDEKDVISNRAESAEAKLEKVRELHNDYTSTPKILAVNVLMEKIGAIIGEEEK